MVVQAPLEALPAEKAWPYGVRCVTYAEPPRDQAMSASISLAAHDATPCSTTTAAPTTSPSSAARPHPAVAGRRLRLGHYCRRPLLLDADHRPLEGARRVAADALAGARRGPKPRLATRWAALVVSWVIEQTPRAFGLFRSRWCCAAVVLLLWRTHHLAVSRETVRRWLHRADLVWRAGPGRC